jgi:CHAT domain-containing protein
VALRAALTLAELNLRSLQSEDTRERWSQETGGAVRTLVELKLREGDTQDALETWEWYHGSALRSGTQGLSASLPSPAQLAHGPALPHLDEVVSHLPILTRETFISYAVFSDGVEMWVYDSRGVSSHWIAFPVKQLRQLALRFRNLCSDPNSDLDYLQRDAHKLYDLLIAPIEQIISTERTLVVEADDALSNLPFEALLDSHGHYLAERVPIVSSLGLYYTDTLRPEALLSKESPALIVAVSAPGILEGDSLPPLPDADDEARMVAARFDFPVLLQGKDATADAWQAHLSGASIFHFAGHAVASTNRAGLLLSDRLLSASSMRSAALSGLQLAVLSACETERGTGDSHLDPDSLVRAFLRGGVPHVIASRWSVDSAATRFFMQTFYGTLLSGTTVSGSLQAAELALKARPGMNHPYYWSAFHALGRS